MEDQLNSKTTPSTDAGQVWRAHQADRAWIEWGICWPPISVGRPRCRACRTAWPCTPALGAHARLADAATRTAMPARWPEVFRG